MREKLYRTVLSVAIVVAGVLAVRWTIRTAMTRAYRAERDVGEAEMPVVPMHRDYSLAAITPKELHVNLAGLAVNRHAERLHIPYSLAVDIADEKATSAGWERMDNPNAITLKNLSGMERMYRTPTGSFVLREVRPIKGDDSVMEDFVLPAEMLPESTEQTTPDALARRSARRVKGLMPSVIRDVVIGSPLLTQLIERGGGAAFIVHCVVDMPADGALNAIAKAAERAGWEKNRFARSGTFAFNHVKRNLTFYYEAIPRSSGGCDVNYRFTDDEVYISNTKGKPNEN